MLRLYIMQNMISDDWWGISISQTYLKIYCRTVSRCPENPQSDQVPASPPQTTAGDGGTHHTPPELLHQAQGRQQARRIHHGKLFVDLNNKWIHEVIHHGLVVISLYIKSLSILNEIIMILLVLPVIMSLWYYWQLYQGWLVVHTCINIHEDIFISMKSSWCYHVVDEIYHGIKVIVTDCLVIESLFHTSIVSGWVVPELKFISWRKNLGIFKIIL